ncbi:SAM-dependent methyltransferase [Sandaracinus amylolyticus]|uniref:SAM-dependent methyltransferase n=1 Tax=Sandaracinus amylolyticus TaxID=927083 RepID=UPI001F237BE1|nr:class I SAM-dependent methyltransferase [Sandaracinus amylolyticus]UJR79209.1 Demethylrebeccamycin-D-glucose O-methyltransferase [Sandaracinus amylolyticus]
MSAAARSAPPPRPSDRPRALRSTRPSDPVAAYYRDKTESILRKYGPGPRVHFHTGLVDHEIHEHDPDAIRAAMTRAQERLLEHVRDRLAPSPARILDVGCGLGGGAIFFANEGHRVVAITNERSHVGLALRFARDAGLADRVRVEHRDAHRPPDERFDAAIAIESSCYFDRARWMRATRASLRPGGVLHVVDCFLGDESERAWFDARWRTRIGPEQEYTRAAGRVGLELVHDEDLAPRARRFWDLSIAWIRATAADRGEAEHHAREHAHLRDALERGAIRYRWLVWRRKG